jgi:polyhydroxybutyrate depolymerase
MTRFGHHPLVLAIAAILLVATSVLAASSIERTIEVDGQVRSYRLFVPENMAGKRLPAIVVFHGGAGKADQIERYTNFTQFAASNGLIAIYPQGINGHWNDGRTDGQQSTADDIAFVRKLIAALASESLIDPKRVYAAGISNGGFMALHLACTIPDVVAGIAVIAAAQPVGAACPAPRQLPIIFFQGTADTFVPIAGGAIGKGPGNRGSVHSHEDTLSFWQKENGCGPPKIREQIAKDSPSGMRVVVENFQCPPGHGLESVTIEGGGHTWPGAQQNILVTRILGPVTDDVDAAEMMWSFFRSQAPAGS